MTKWAAQVPVTVVAAPDFPRVVATANALVGGDKGLLAIDESIPTCNKRFARLGIGQTEDDRRAYRELLVTTPDSARASAVSSCATRRFANAQPTATHSRPSWSTPGSSPASRWTSAPNRWPLTRARK
jgi:hypothetical protein